MNNPEIKKRKKRCKKGECKIYSVLEKIAPLYNKSFKVLKLPQSLNIDTEKNEITLPEYEGRKYNNLWSTESGGKLMGLELSSEVAEMINDLFKIDMKRIESFEEIKEINYLKFDYDKWKKNFYVKIEKYEEKKLLSKEEINKAKTIFDEPYKSTYIFNNGDFYPRNFIKLKNRVVLIDWDDWDGSYRANIIDYWENILAFCFIHMWSNHFWQLNFLKSIQKRFKINPSNLQKALLIKSFEQADYWFEKGDKFEAQLSIFKNALDIEYVNYLINYTKPSMIRRFLVLLKRTVI